MKKISSEQFLLNKLMEENSLGKEETWFKEYQRSLWREEKTLSRDFKRLISVDTPSASGMQLTDSVEYSTLSVEDIYFANLDQKTLSSALHQALSELKPADRKMFIEIHVIPMSLKAYSQAHNLPASTLQYHHAKIRTRLQSRILELLSE